MNRDMKLAIFDMDGTLFDTSEANYRAYRDAAETVGATIDRDTFLRIFVGKNYRDFLPCFGIREESLLRKVHEEKKRRYPNHLSCVRKNEFLFDILRHMKPDYQICLATTASRKNTEDILERFQARDLFDLLIAQEDVKTLKPDPACFLLAMERSGAKPENTVIFEDSDAGVEAAQRSGAAVFRVCAF